MAEPDHDADSSDHLTTASGQQGAGLAASSLSPHAPPFQQQHPPLYEGAYLPMNSHTTFENPNVLGGPASSQLHELSPYPPAGPRYPYYQPHIFPYQFTGHPGPLPSFWNGTEQVHPDPSFFNTGMPMQGYPPVQTIGMPPQNSRLAASVNRVIPPYAQRHQQHRMAMAALSRNHHAGGMHAPHQGHRDSAHPDVRLQSIRSRPYDNLQRNNQNHAGSGHRPRMPPGGHGHSSNRSISPRTPSRRGVVRFPDLESSSMSSDAGEAAVRAPSSNRLRTRTREGRPRFAGSRPYNNPNIATSKQIQELKDSLLRRLPGDLPNDVPKDCAICQNEYSASYVPPIEGSEIAVMLSCGHIFGEYCIFEWFDTCRNQKNKVTCPMCRKHLIDRPRHPPRHPQPMMHTYPQRSPAFGQLLAPYHSLVHAPNMM